MLLLFLLLAALPAVYLLVLMAAASSPNHERPQPVRPTVSPTHGCLGLPVPAPPPPVAQADDDPMAVLREHVEAGLVNRRLRGELTPEEYRAAMTRLALADVDHRLS